MTRFPTRWSWSHATARLLFCAPLWLAACATQDDKIAAVQAVDAVYGDEYRKILEEKGSRRFPVSRAQAFAAMRAALLDLSMQIDEEDPTIGFLGVVGNAPLPLNSEEWKTVRRIELPRLRDIASKHVGWLLTWFVDFRPEGLQIRITATVLDRGGSSELNLTMRMKDLKPDPNLPRRTYPPPTAVRIGLDKIWARFEQQLQRLS